MTICEPIYAQSLQYVDILVRSDLVLGTQDVSLAFLTDTEDRPAIDDWIEGEWTEDNKHVRVLVGPGGDITLAPGRYYVWIRIISPPETPVLSAGVLTVD